MRPPALSSARWLPALAVAALLAVPCASASAALSDEIIVAHAPSADAAERAEVRADAGVALEQRLPMAGVEVVTTDGSRADALAELRADPDVRWAEPNRPMYATTQDTYWGDQWGLSNSGLYGTPDADADFDDAWAVTKGAGVTVGVVDSGLEGTHPDLAGRWVAGQSFVSGYTASTDAGGHGTHVAGIITAAQNTIGVSGGAPDARVQPFRVFGAANTSATTAAVAAAFAAAGDAGLKVVNASLGGPGVSVAIEQAITSHPGTLYVVAAGNDGADVDSGAGTYPCASPAVNVVCVGASNPDDTVAYYSNTGSTSVDLFAPGSQIKSTYLNGGYAFLSGTSMATPMTSAAAALIVSAHPAFAPAQIKRALLSSVDHPATLSGASVTGGRLNAAQALVAAADPVTSATPTPSPSPTATPTPSPSPTATPTPPPGPTDVPSPTVLASPPVAASPSVVPSPDVATSPTPAPTSTATPAPPSTPTATPVFGPPTPTVTPRPTSTPTPAPHPTATQAPVPAPTAPVVERPSTPTPAPTANTGNPSSGPTVTDARPILRGSRLTGIRLTTSAAGTVRLEVFRRAGSRLLRASNRTVKVSGGRQQLGIDRATLGTRLTRGEWKVAFEGAAGSRAVLTLRVR